MKILVSGASGFIGSSLVNGLSKAGFRMTAVSRRLSDHTFSKEVNVLVESLTNQPLGSVMNAQPDVFIHSVGSPSVTYSQVNPALDFESTVDTTVAALESLRKLSNNSLFVLISSAAVYGDSRETNISEKTPINPKSTYGYNKYLAEMVVREYASQYGIRTLILRPFSVYGECLRKQVIYDLSHKFLTSQGEVVIDGTGNETRDFLHVNDLAYFLSEMIKQKVEGEFNMGTGVSTTLKELASQISTELSPNAKFSFTGEESVLHPQYLVSDISKLNALGLKPLIDINYGLKSVCKHISREVGNPK